MGPPGSKLMTLERRRVHPAVPDPRPAPGGFHRIRYFGLFANTGRAANLAKLRALLEPQSAPPAVQAANDNVAIKDAFPCPCCGGRMRLIEVFERGAQPRLAPDVHRARDR